jgi:peptide/nickel transport system permease protein
VKQKKLQFSTLFGLLIIGLALLVSVLGATIRPDSSKDSNTQLLALAGARPGTSVSVLEFGKESSPWYKMLFFGGAKPAAIALPIDSFWVEEKTIFYLEYSKKGNSLYPKKLEQEVFSKWVNANLQGVELENEIRSNFLNQITFYLGADRFGRDLLSRLMAGTIVSLSVGVIAVVISLLVGIFLGGAAGYLGGWPDKLIMWVVNVVWSIPTLLMVMAITLALGKGFVQVFLAVGLTMWVEVARVTRGEFLRLREQNYIHAARLMGFSNLRIMFKHMLPNATAPLIVISAGNFATAILLEAGLSFLGIGAQVPMASWGGIIKSHFNYLTTDKAFLALIPGLFLVLLVLAFMLLGNALRNKLDVKN